MEASPNPWAPVEQRPRQISKALRAYAAFASSADKGGVRML
jgi:dihydroxy-acid dehydratase